MATSITVAQQKVISQLYVAFFNRAADSEGLGYWAGKLAAGVSLNDIAQSMYSTEPARAYYSTALTNEQFVKAFYATVLNRPTPDAEGLAYWTALLNQPGQTQGSVANSIITAVGSYAGTLPEAVAAKTMFDARVSVSTEYALHGGTAAGASTALSGVVDAATAAAAIANLGSGVVGSTFTLTINQDTLTGTAGNDTFTSGAALDGAGKLINSLQGVDALNGGAGVDTLNVTLDATAAGAPDVVTPSLTSIENVNLRVTKAGSAIDFVGSTGVTAVTVANSTAATGKIDNVGAAALAVKNQKTAVDFDHSTATNLSLTVDGAGTVSATAPVVVAIDLGKATASKATTLTVTANASNVEVKDTTGGSIATTVSIAATGANTIKLTDGATTATAVTLTGAGSVDLTGVTLTALKTLTVADGGVKATINNQTAAAVAVTTGAGVDTVAVNGAGLKSIATGAGNDAVTVSNAAQVALIATYTAFVDDAAAAAGTAAATTAAVAAGAITAAQKTAIDTAAGTTKAAGITAVTDIATASGVVSATATVDLGAGNDSLTLGSAFAAGATLTGGDGTDTLGMAKADYATVIGGGAYTPAVLAKVTGFEVLSINDVLVDADSAIDVSKIAGITSFTAAAGVTAGQTLAGVIGLGANSTVTLAGAAGNNGTLNVTLAADTATDVLNLVLNKDYTDNNDTVVDAVAAAQTVVAAGVETINVNTTGKMATIATKVDGYKADLVTNTLTLTGSNKLVTLNVTGDQALDFTSTKAMVKLATIDASTNTGGLKFDGHLADVDVAGNSPAMTIKGSATASNTIVGSGNADTITGGAKADTITGGKGGDILTGNGGNDKFVFAAGDSSIGTGTFDTITDFVANKFGNGLNGAAGTQANLADATKVTGDVLSFTHTGTATALNGFKVFVASSASDATTFLANTASVSNAQASVALDSSANNLYVDVSGDGVADFYIHLTGVATLDAAAFTLV